MQDRSESMSNNSLAPRKEILGWAMYDFGNQAYNTLIITVIYGVMFTRVIVGDEPDFRLGNLLWSLSLCTSYALVLLLAPISGAIMDYTRSKKKFLFAAYVVTITTTFCLYFVTPGMIATGMLLIIISNLAFSIGECFIAGFLPHLGPKKSLGKISGFGWAFGYLGGLLSTGIVLLGLGEIHADNFQNMRYVGPLTAGFFLVGALPAFLWLRERGEPQSLPSYFSFARIGWSRVRRTIQDLPFFRDLAVFLSSLFFAMAGLHIIISFAFIYGDQVVGWDPEIQMLMFVITQISAASGAMLFGVLLDRIGAKYTFTFTLILWMVCISLIYFTPTMTGLINQLTAAELEAQHFFLGIGLLAGLGLGSLQSSARTMVGRLTPAHKEAEFFGFWGVSIRLAAITGILGVGLFQLMVGLQASILFCLFLFLTALVLNIYVDEERGMERASTYSPRQM